MKGKEEIMEGKSRHLQKEGPINETLGARWNARTAVMGKRKRLITDLRNATRKVHPDLRTGDAGWGEVCYFFIGCKVYSGRNEENLN